MFSAVVIEKGETGQTVTRTSIEETALPET